MLRALCMLLVLGALPDVARSMRVYGTWLAADQRVQVLAKFGVQPVDQLQLDASRGYVFGNVSSTNGRSSDSALFVVPESRFHSFRHEGPWKFDCKSLLQNITEILYEPRCFTDGKQRGDFMRWVPCPEGELCVDEENPAGPIPGHQFTFRLDEPYVPEYWYAVLVACRLDANCSWVESERIESVDYDLTLLNGHPQKAPFLSRHFSFEQQETLQVLYAALLCFLLLSLVQWRATAQSRFHTVQLRSQLLTWTLHLEVCRLGLQVFNMTLYARNGWAFPSLNFLSEVVRNLGASLLCLLLLLLGSGWSLRKPGTRLLGYYVFNIWAVITVLHLMVFAYDYLCLEDVRNYFDFLESDVANLMVGLRLLQGVWFLVEMKKTLRVEINQERAVFLVHFGAAYMVWFTYYLLLMFVSSAVSEFSRTKFVVCVMTFANFVALACLVHILWPHSSYRKFFSSDMMVHRSLSNASSGQDVDEYDLLMGTLHSDDEGPDSPFR